MEAKTMNKCLITGCGGFIGSHLAEFLLEKGMSIYGTVHQDKKSMEHRKDRIKVFECDIADRKTVEDIIDKVKPDLIFHLASQSLVLPSWKDPEWTFKVNILGTLYLLEAVRKAGLSPLIEIICSSAEYGLNYQHEVPVKESKEFRPGSPYGVSKVGQDMVAYLYWHTYGMKIIRIRPFNITGPGKTLDACSDFAKGIAEIESGQSEVLEVGNLEPIRDITDVRDCVEAMWLLAEKGNLGDVYNICSGKGYKMRGILEKLISLSSRRFEIHQAPQKMRPSDEPIYIGDNSKLSQLGWKPRFSIDKTLSDMLNYWRR